MEVCGEGNTPLEFTLDRVRAVKKVEFMPSDNLVRLAWKARSKPQEVFAIAHIRLGSSPMCLVQKMGCTMVCFKICRMAA